MTAETNIDWKDIAINRAYAAFWTGFGYGFAWCVLFVSAWHLFE